MKRQSAARLFVSERNIRVYCVPKIRNKNETETKRHGILLKVIARERHAAQIKKLRILHMKSNSSDFGESMIIIKQVK